MRNAFYALLTLAVVVSVIAFSAIAQEDLGEAGLQKPEYFE
jgi:hypothetical protein